MNRENGVVADGHLEPVRTAKGDEQVLEVGRSIFWGRWVCRVMVIAGIVVIVVILGVGTSLAEEALNRHPSLRRAKGQIIPAVVRTLGEDVGYA